MRNVPSFLLAVGLTACVSGGRQVNHETVSVSWDSSLIEKKDVGEVECTMEVVKDGVRQTCCLIFNDKDACWEGGLAEMSKVNVKTVNGKDIVGYDLVKGQVSAEQYKEYVVSKIDGVRGVGEFVGQMVKYKRMDDGLLYSSNDVIQFGGGDCDNLANLFKDLLQRVGEKIGHDYQCKVVAMPMANHAVAVFLDRDGQWKSFDQRMPFLTIGERGEDFDLHKASKQFGDYQSGDDEKENLFCERKKLTGSMFGRGAFYDWYFEGGNIELMDELLVVVMDKIYDREQVPLSFCPVERCGRFERVEVQFNDAVAYYSRGRLTEFQYGNEK